MTQQPEPPCSTTNSPDNEAPQSEADADTNTRCWNIGCHGRLNPDRSVLDTSVEGGFTDHHGVFDASDTIGGRPELVRFEWTVVNPKEPHWQQSFSYDGGITSVLNWTMRLTPRG